MVKTGQIFASKTRLQRRRQRFWLWFFICIVAGCGLLMAVRFTYAMDANCVSPCLHHAESTVKNIPNSRNKIEQRRKVYEHCLRDCLEKNQRVFTDKR